MPISKKLQERLDRRKRLDVFYGNYAQKKQSRKSVSYHKRRILARLSPKVNKGQEIMIMQQSLPEWKQSSNSQQTLLYIQIKDRDEHINGYPMRDHPVQENHRIVKALRYLVEEGKLESSMSTKEWTVQLALGTANTRKFCKKG
ncbi:hypothetical protein LCGC14_1457900 [marine sediment metagenome]|uniref:Uncharacterized protein n=1 Tax=marine sediment metagenome TaxID=412755 RepID=A0A0F9MHV4_9ZZZZ